MSTLVGKLLSLAFDWVAGHPDLLEELWTKVTHAIDAHFTHASPVTQEAVTDLETSVHLAAINAIAAAQARMSTKFKPGQTVP